MRVLVFYYVGQTYAVQFVPVFYRFKFLQNWPHFPRGGILSGLQLHQVLKGLQVCALSESIQEFLFRIPIAKQSGVELLLIIFRETL